MLEEATTYLSPTVVSNFALARSIRKEFPNAISKKAGDKRQMYVYGMEKASAGLVELDRALIRNEQLEKQLQELQQRVDQLEKEKESLISIGKFEGQMQSLLNPNLTVYHGPDTTAHLQAFSLDSLIQEFTANAPDVMDLIQHLGNCGRYGGSDADDYNLSTVTQRTVTSLCTLLKCRSVKLLGLQLLISIMLIARATHKQV